MMSRRIAGYREYRILVPVPEPQHAQSVVRLAAALLSDRPGEIVVVGIVEMPPERSLSQATTEARTRRRQIDELVATCPDLPVRLRRRVRVSHQAWSDLEPIIREEEIDLLLAPWSCDPDAPVLGLEADELLAAASCDVILVPAMNLATAGQILLPMRGGPHAALSLRVALSLADANQASITLLHAPEDASRSVVGGRFDDFAPFLRSLTPLVRQVRATHADPTTAIVQEISGHDVVIMGATMRSTTTPAIGPVTRAVARQATKPLILVQAHPPVSMPAGPWPGWEPALPPVVTPLSTVVDKWFAENTFDSDEFADLDRLVEEKLRQGISISLGLPALNEEETVGRIIETIQETLVRRHPLLDEIVLIDSGSTDRTVEITRDLGVPVYESRDILPAYGSYRGKGEALWKSLYVLKGDIIAWIDTDIKNIGPHFVYGIVGPLLRHRRIQYVKGFYRRPIRVGKKLHASGGGRVTELVARPMINLFFPELSGLAQPLAGEYAGRRSALEQLPFFVGYGVEIGLLIDLLDRFGLQAIAQVDLRERIHRNQPLGSLSKMSFAILQVVMSRMEERHKVKLLAEINRTMKLIQYSEDYFHLEEASIGDVERPPMATIPEYLEKQSGKEQEMVR